MVLKAGSRLALFGKVAPIGLRGFSEIFLFWCEFNAPDSFRAIRIEHERNLSSMAGDIPASLEIRTPPNRSETPGMIKDVFVGRKALVDKPCVCHISRCTGKDCVGCNLTHHTSHIALVFPGVQALDRLHVLRSEESCQQNIAFKVTHRRRKRLRNKNGSFLSDGANHYRNFAGNCATPPGINRPDGDLSSRIDDRGPGHKQLQQMRQLRGNFFFDIFGSCKESGCIRF
mmetsp:Transcript_43422/g.85007  ORF Transcript_43422/g.85007 Transcript_43422/m.85007 type:complete len:229 (-) Transcript_43422:824-1510(-)